MVVEKNGKVVGTVTINQHNDSDEWWVNVHAFSEDRFKESMEEVLSQSAKDDYVSWKGEKASSAGFRSKGTLFNAAKSLLANPTKDNKLFSFTSLYQKEYSLVLDHILAKWKPGTNLGAKFIVQENFRKYGSMIRLVIVNGPKTDIMIAFEPKANSTIGIEIAHEEDFSQVNEELFTPASITKVANQLIKSTRNDGYQLVWSSGEDWQFFFQFNGYFSQSNIPGDYMVMLVYEKSRFRAPSATFSATIDGQVRSISTDVSDAKDVMSKFQINAMKFSISKAYPGSVVAMV